ncbi:MAG TPA: substrate-binding domain-containing protein [Candidatus Acidoferrum sp.]|nr:substrate-binding domain-containing protein [Candidatus Acidoferrum sp.]
MPPNKKKPRVAGRATPARRTQQLPRVAVLVDTSTSWGRRVIQGINRYARAHGPWQIFVEARGLEERLRLPPGWEGDGVIARVANAQMIEDLTRLGLPIVNVSGIQVPGSEIFPRVTSDLPAGAALALDHFLQRGFRHFAYFSLTGLSYVSVQEDAFVTAVRNADHECEVYSVTPSTGAEPDWTLDLKQLGKWLKNLPKPVGILTWNASSSREIIYACQMAGLLVPEEVAIISGADDDVLCEVLHVPLSAIHVAAEQIGERASETLDELMQGASRSRARVKAVRRPLTPILVPPLLVVTRQSTDTLAVRDPALVKALSFIRMNAAQPIQVSQVARQSGISRRALERRFLQALGRSPAGEIRRVHLERAKTLLAETVLPIPQIAEAAGFGSPEYLAYVFRNELGKTPLRYRKEIGRASVVRED